MQPMKIGGWRKDVTDPQRPPSLSFSTPRARFAAAAVAPAGDHLIPEAIPCFDQGGIGSCVLNAWCGALQILLGLENKPAVPLSRLFLYWLCRDQMNERELDEGTYPHLAADRLSRVGVCAESSWAYDPANVFTAPPLAVFGQATANRVNAFYRIDSSGDQRLADIETAIRANHPVVFGTPVDNAIRTYSAGEVLSTPTGPHIGAHAMLFTGILTRNGRRVFRVRNSWGTDYGDNGHLLISDEWAAWPQLDDVWVATRMDALLTHG